MKQRQRETNKRRGDRKSRKGLTGGIWGARNRGEIERETWRHEGHKRRDEGGGTHEDYVETLQREEEVRSTAERLETWRD